MKKLSTLVILLVAIYGCNQGPQRYAEDAPEIEALKKLSSFVKEENRATFKALYADSAKIYWNSVTPLTWQEAVRGVDLSLEPFTEMKYLDGTHYEKITTNSGEVWVSFWGVWQGKIRDTEILVQVPVHISSRFENGKIVEESGYWDNHILTNALQNAGYYGND